MNCGWAIECYAAAAGNGLLDWLMSLLTFNTVIAIWIGAFIGAQFGWPGFIAVTFGAASYLQRKQSADTHEHVSGKDAAPVARPRTGTSKAKPAKSSRSGTLADFFKGLGK
jgi:hypothetical protein